MRIEIIAVGRARAGPERDLYDEWLRRIRWPVNLREIEEKRDQIQQMGLQIFLTTQVGE